MTAVRLLSLSLLLALAACAGGATSGSLSLADLSARLPAEAAGLRLAGPPTPDTSVGVREGVLARYQAGWGFATVFLFQRDDAAVPDGLVSEATRRELADAAAVAALFTTARNASQVGMREGTIRGAGVPDLSCIVAEGVATTGATTGSVQADYTCVTGLLGRVFKLRVTARRDAVSGDALNRTVATFAGAVMRGLSGIAVAGPVTAGSASAGSGKIAVP